MKARFGDFVYRGARGVVVAAYLASHFSASALTISVDPISGTLGGNPTTTIANAFAQINAGADTSNSILLRRDALHVVAASTVISVNSGRNVLVDAGSGAGRPRVRLTSAPTQYNLQILQAADHSTTLTFRGLDVIPEMGNLYNGSTNDALFFQNGGVVLTDCVFGGNSGSDTVASSSGAAAYGTTGNVGDDYLVFDEANAELRNCTVTGCFDDAVGVFTTTRQVYGLLAEGTVIANVGGAGFLSDSRVSLRADGSAGRVLIARCGQRAGESDSGVRLLGDTLCSLAIRKTDIVQCTASGIRDQAGCPLVEIRESRIALNNTANETFTANIAINDTQNSGIGNSPVATSWILDRATIHDGQGGANPAGIVVRSGGQQPRPVWTINDTIVSGSGDTFALLNSGQTSVSAVFSAVVTAGAHAVSATGDFGGGNLGADPNYASTTYAIGRSTTNENFLRPTSAGYAAAGTGGSALSGGASAAPPAGVAEWLDYVR